MLLSAVLTSAGCCLPFFPGLSVNGIHVTIGAYKVQSTFTIVNPDPASNAAPKYGYYEFVQMDSSRPRRIFTPAQYADRENLEWDICLIVLKQEYNITGNGRPLIGKPF